MAHNARFDVGVLKQAFERAELEWPDPPVLCTVALARRLAPLQRRRGLASLADALGIEVSQTPPRAARRRDLRARAVRAAAAPVRERPHDRRGARAARARASRRATSRSARSGRATSGPTCPSLPKDPGVYIFRDADGRPLYVGKSICLRTRARAHFTTPATWTGEAEHVDYQPTESELGALVLENRLIKALKPPGNTLLKKDADGYVYLRCRLDIPFPILEVAREPAAGHAVCIGPVRGRAAAAELVEQLNSLFGLRHCGRALTRRPHPSAYGQMGRCLSPCLGDLDPNLYRERLDEALRLFEVDGASALLAHVDAQMRAAAAAEQFERAAWLRRRARRLESLLGRLGGALRAAHAGARLVVVPHPADARPGRRVLDRRRPDRRLGPAAARRGRGRGPHRHRARRRAAPLAGRLAAGGRARRDADRRPLARRPRRGARARARAAAGPEGAGGVQRESGGRPPQASTESGPSGSRSCAGAGLVAGAGRRSSATTCVTEMPVKPRDAMREVVLQPLRAAAGQRADDRLVVARGIEALGHRVHRVRVADHAVSLQARVAHRGQRLVEPFAHRLAPTEPGTLRGHHQRDPDRAPARRGA